MAHRSSSTMVCAKEHSLCLSNDGNVFSFGNSSFRAHGHDEALILEPKMIPSFKNIKYIDTAVLRSVCLDTEGNVFTFGINYKGQLGIGIDEEKLKYTHIPQKVNLPPCKQISCNSHSTLCLTEDGILYSFGYNEEGQLGLGNNEENYNSPQLISSLKDVEFIECGGNHTFCKTLNNEIYCWGKNESGQLGLENNDNQNTPILCSSLSNEDIIDIKCGANHTLVLTSNGDVLSSGSNQYGQLGRTTDAGAFFYKIEILSGIKRIECKDHHSMCIDSNNDLYVFGNNEYGQLGLGDRIHRYQPIKHPSLSNIIDISKGTFCTFVKTSNNEIFYFGKDNINLSMPKKQKQGLIQYVGNKIGTRNKLEDKYQLTPIRVFENNEDIWCYNTNRKSKAKSARNIN